MKRWHWSAVAARFTHSMPTERHLDLLERSAAGKPGRRSMHYTVFSEKKTKHLTYLQTLLSLRIFQKKQIHLHFLQPISSFVRSRYCNKEMQLTMEGNLNYAWLHGHCHDSSPTGYLIAVIRTSKCTITELQRLHGSVAEQRKFLGVQIPNG